MSKKSKQAEQERLARMQEQAKRANRAPRVEFRIMNNCMPVPVAKPADFVQLTPVVQPIPIVPYSSQLQPLAQFDDEDGAYDEDYDY